MTALPVKGYAGPLLEDEPLASRTTWRIGGPARWLAMPQDGGEVCRLVRGRAPGVPLLVLGGGSNLLLPDEGFAGLVVSLQPGLAGVSLHDQGDDGVRLVAGGGLSTRRLAHLARHHGLTGMEFLAGIPGSVGGAVVMNAGAYGGEISHIVEAVEVVDEDGVRRVLSHAQLGLGYRSSTLPAGWIITAAHFRLARGDAQEIRQRMRGFNRQRGASQPLAWPSAGSTFKNPPVGPPAWALIDQAGLRGVRAGGGQVSEKHCNFLINRENATAAHMMQLMELVRQTVFRSSGIVLELEVKIVGSDGTLRGLD